MSRCQSPIPLSQFCESPPSSSRRPAAHGEECKDRRGRQSGSDPAVGAAAAAAAAGTSTFVSVRLRVEPQGRVQAQVRCVGPSPSAERAATQFSLLRLQQALAAVFPEPWTPAQSSLVRDWQTQAAEQDETVTRLRRALDSAQTHVESLEERCAVLLRQLRRFEQRQLSFEGLHSAPSADPRKEQAQLRRENRFLTEALSQTEADLFHVLHSYGALTSGLLEEIGMHLQVHDSIKQLLLEAHDLSGNAMDRGLAELQTQRLKLLEKLTVAYRAAAAESQRASALAKQNEELREQNAQLLAQVARLRRGVTPTGMPNRGFGYYD